MPAQASQASPGDASAATSATLALPHGITIDAAGNLYLADTENHRIRRIDATTGIITTAAGDGLQAFSGDKGPAIASSLDSPRNATVSPSSLLTLADTGNQRVRQLTAAPAPTTTIQTIAGLGLSTPGALTLSAPSVIAYGTGQLTATLASPSLATGSVTFLDTTSTTVTLGTAPLASNVAILPSTSMAAGPHNLTATYTGDQTHLSAQSPTLALTITPQPLTATAASITILYGQPVPSISGTLTGVLPQDESKVSASFTSAATTLSPVGTYPITATLTGPAAGNYTLTPTSATLTINPAPTIVTLSNLIATATAGSSLTLTAQVASTTSGTPSGSVTLLDGSASLVTTPLSATGVAAFTIPSLTQGSHSFTAVYTGTTNFNAGTSAPQLITVGTGTSSTPDFTLAPTGATTQTVLSGNSATFTFAVQFQGNMASPITLAATGLPTFSTASFNPPTLPPGSATNTFTLTIATPNTTASKNRALSPPTAWALLLCPIAALCFRSRTPRLATGLLLSAIITLSLFFVIGCGDRINTSDALLPPPTSYTITVTGTATTSTGSPLQHATTVTLLLQQPQ